MVRHSRSGSAKAGRWVFRVLLGFGVVTMANVSPHAVEAATTPLVQVRPKAGPPTSTVQVVGKAFGANETVDIYFDATLTATAVTNARGSFPATSVVVPTTATPGAHVFRAKGETSNLRASAQFVVRSDWPQYLYGPDHLGVNPYEKVLNVSNISTLSFSFAAYGSDTAISSPIVAGGILFMKWVGGNISAFDASNGNELWSLMFASNQGGLSYDNGLLFAVPGGTPSSTLRAMDPHTGSTVWQIDAPAGIGPLSAPTVANGAVYIAENDGTVMAVDEATGLQLWSVATGSPDINSAPAVSGGILYVGASDGWVYALDASSGAVVWKKQPTTSSVFSSPSVSNGVAYVGSYDDKLYALDAATGATVWASITGGQVDSSPAISNGIVYIGSWDGKLWAFDANTGSLKWASAATGGVDSAPPAIANGVVYEGSDDKSLYAYNATTGVLLWSVATDIIQSHAAAIVNGVVYASANGYVSAYSLP